MINLMRKLTAVLFGLFSFAFVVRPAFAAPITICPANSTFSKLCELNFNNVGDVIGKLIVLLLIVAVIVSVFFLIYGGIKWITSGGDKTGVESARNHIIAAIVGLIIALLAFFILNFVGGFFGISLTNLQPPTLTNP